MSMDQLRGRLDDSISALMPAPPAPVEGTIRKGKVIRLRRRVVAVAGVAAVVAAAIFTPLAVHWQSAGPATTNYTVTVQPPGPHSPGGEIAQGTVNGKAWQIVWQDPCRSPALQPPTQCVAALGTPFARDNIIDTYGPDPEDPYDSSAPLGLQYVGGGVSAAGMIGAVQKDVSFVTVTLNNGTVLTLHPVVVRGLRSVAFAEPVGATILSATAYSRTGEIATAIPLTLPNGDSMFATWLKPGQQGLARVTGVIASGPSWSASADIGPWGTCIVMSAGGSTSTCNTPFSSIVQWWLLGAETGPTLGAATLPVTRIVFQPPKGPAITVRPVTIGGQKFFCVIIPKITPPSGDPLDALPWTAYDAAGHVIGTGDQ